MRQLTMHLIFDTHIYEVQTLINKLRRLLQTQRVSSTRRRHAETEIRKCLNALQKGDIKWNDLNAR